MAATQPKPQRRCGQQAETDGQANEGKLERNSQSTRKLRGRTHGVNYNTKWHPMDEWTRPRRFAKSRSGTISGAKDESKHARKMSEQKSSSPEEIEKNMITQPRYRFVEADSSDLPKHNLRQQKMPVNKTSHHVYTRVRPKRAVDRRVSIVIQDSDSDIGSIIREDTYEENTTSELPIGATNSMVDWEPGFTVNADTPFQLQPAEKLRAYCHRADKPTNAFLEYQKQSLERQTDLQKVDLSRKHRKREYASLDKSLLGRKDTTAKDAQVPKRRNVATLLSPTRAKGLGVSKHPPSIGRAQRIDQVIKPSNCITQSFDDCNFRRDGFIGVGNAGNDVEHNDLGTPKANLEGAQLKPLAGRTSSESNVSFHKDDYYTSSWTPPSAQTLISSFACALNAAPVTQNRGDNDRSAGLEPEANEGSIKGICATMEELLEYELMAEERPGCYEQSPMNTATMTAQGQNMTSVGRSTVSSACTPQRATHMHSYERMIPHDFRDLIADRPDTIAHDICKFVEGAPASIKDLLLTTMLMKFRQMAGGVTLTIVKPYCGESERCAPTLASAALNYSAPIYLQMSQSGFLNDTAIDDKFSSSPTTSSCEHRDT